MNRKRGVILLSGGMDSATLLYLAKRSGYDATCLIFDYGQRHRKEITAAQRIARRAGCNAHLVKINLPWKGSTLLDKKVKLPKGDIHSRSIPSTYVPARNIIFLSFALSCAEAINARAIFIGAHTEDYSGYPDCRKEFFSAFEEVVKKGTKAGSKDKGIAIEVPLINSSKKEIVWLANSLKVPLELTWSCYQGARLPCGKCDSCLYRAKGFLEAGLKDPLYDR
ncbi:MAG: 7-cyano-7-deazaguanine synthase QueC [Candidatus Omnitrophota bacterium]